MPRPNIIQMPKRPPTKAELREELLDRWKKQARKEGLSEQKTAHVAEILLWWHKLEK
jgi:hypothetical protein